MTNRLKDITEWVDDERVLKESLVNKTHITWGYRFHLQKSLDHFNRYSVEVSIEGTYRIVFSGGMLTTDGVILVADKFKINLNVE